MRKSIILAALAAGVVSAPALADGPDYDGTVAYIQSLVNGSVTEVKRCVFAVKMPTSGGDHTLTVNGLGIDPIVVQPKEVHFECMKGKTCLAPSGEGQAASKIRFDIHSDAQGFASTVSRLIELCGVHGH